MIYHFLYKTTNLVNNKYYIGVHSTKKLEDGYLGSGTLIQRAIQKYGAENFQREVLCFFNTKAEAFQAEKDYLTDEVLNDPLNYNIQPGGKSWDTVTAKNFHIYLQKRLQYFTDEELAEIERKHLQKIKEMAERQRGLNNPESKKRFEAYKSFFNNTMKFLYEETTVPEYLIEWLFMGKGFARGKPMQRFIETGLLRKPIKTVTTNCCSFQQKQKKTLFTEKPIECVILDILDVKYCQSVKRRFDHLPDLIRFSEDLSTSNSMLINGNTDYKCEMSDARWFIERGILREEKTFIKVQKIDGRVLNKVEKSIFKLVKNNVIILDKELNQYEINQFGQIFRVGKFEK